MKRFYFLKGIAFLLILLFSQTLSAQDSKIICLQVFEKDGTQVNFAVDDDPVITFEDLKLIVTAEYGIEVPIDDIAYYCFNYDVPTTGPTSNKIESTVAASTEFSNGKVYIQGLKGNATIYVYSVNGQQVMAVKASADGSATVDLTALKHGAVYVLRTPGASYKLMNK